MQSVFKQASLRISTARLNRIIRGGIERNAPPMRKNRRPRIYFASQISALPPTIMLRCNDATLLDEGWKRYLLGYLREATPFREVPIRLVLRSRNEVDPDAVAQALEEEPLDIMDLSDDQLDDGDRSLGLDADLHGEDVSAQGLLMLDDEDADFEEDPDYPAPNFIDDDSFRG